MRSCLSEGWVTAIPIAFTISRASSDFRIVFSQIVIIRQADRSVWRKASHNNSEFVEAAQVIHLRPVPRP